MDDIPAPLPPTPSPPLPSESPGPSEHADAARTTRPVHVYPLMRHESMQFTPPTARDSLLEVVKFVVDHPLFSFIMIAATVWALFADDFSRVLLPKSVDVAFLIVTTVVFGLFVFELIGNSVAYPRQYFWFYFLLDLLAALSLVPDILLLAGIETTSSDSQTGASSLAVARAGRAARAAARAARFVRVVKLIQVIRRRRAKLDAQMDEEDRLLMKELEEEEHRRAAVNAAAAAQLDPNASADGLLMDAFENVSSTSALSDDQSRSSNDSLLPEFPDQLARNPPAAAAAAAADDDDDEPAADAAGRSPKRTASLFGGAPEWDALPLQRKGSGSSTGSSALRLAEADAESDDDSSVDLAFGEEELLEPSRVGQLLNDLTTKKVIVLVLVMLLVFSLLNIESDSSLQSVVALSQLELFARTSNTSDPGSAYASILALYRSMNNELVLLQVAGATELHDPARIDALRTFEIEKIWSDSGASVSWFDAKAESQLDALLSMAMTFFIIVVLSVGNWMLSKDAQALVIGPIERMTAIVKRLAQNPLTSLSTKKKDALETHLLESMLSKIGSLLQIGFGESGAKIISYNLRENGEIDPMVPGRKVEAIFVHCEVAKFSDVTEILQEDAILFLNLVCDILHSVASEHGGFPFSNKGSSFGLVWNLPAEEETTPEAYLGDLQDVAVSVLAAIEIVLDRLANSETIQVLLQRVPHFKAKLSFGVHVGWAVVGALGSKAKVDASYVSPHVELTGALVSVGRSMRLPVVFSHHFAELLQSSGPEDFGSRSVKVDRVQFKGIKQPVQIFTLLSPPPSFLDGDGDGDNATPIADVFVAAVDEYLGGRWETARSLLHQAKTEISNAGLDASLGLAGPVKFLMRFIEKYDFQAPDAWRGYRKET